MKKRFIFIVAICTLAMCFTACPIIADPVAPASLIGTWKCSLTDAYYGEFQYTLTINDDGTYSSVTYDVTNSNAFPTDTGTYTIVNNEFTKHHDNNLLPDDLFVYTLSGNSLTFVYASSVYYNYIRQ